MSVAVAPAPPSPFPDINTEVLAEGSVLHRNHAASFRSTELNPCKGQPTRFAPFADDAGKCVPTLYAATSREAAAFETIFHDVEPTAAFKTVRLAVVDARSVSRIAPRRQLLLARLFAPDLKAWGLSRAQLIETSKATYSRTVLWAEAAHRARRDIDGLIWTSRQCDPERCLVLFGDRVTEADLREIESLDVRSDATLLREMRDFGRRAGITIIA